MADTNFSSGTVVTSTWLNDINDIVYGLSNSDLTKGDALLSVKQPFSNTITTTQHAFNRRIISVEDFGALGDGSVSTTDMLTYLTNAWNSALTNGHDLYFPPGTYDTGIANFPFKNSVNTSLLECNNLTLWCSGPSTIFKTTSVDGADVLQLNAVKNLHVRGFPTLTGSVSGSASGTNGVSITNGGDNITLEVFCKNLPSLDKTTFVDGGKAVTIQPGKIIAKGCSEGFGYEPDLATSLTKKTAINVDIMAEDCLYAVKMVSAASTGALSTSMTSGVHVRAHSINCQKDLALNRVHSGYFDIQVITTKTAAARRLNPNGITWFAADTTVEAFLCTYAHNVKVFIQGNKGACDYKARIGGAAAGSSGLTGASDDCSIHLDIGGTASTADILDVDSGGNTLKNSILYVTNRTASTLPDAFHSGSLKNALKIGSVYSGNFTATLTGCTTSPTGSVEWTIDNNEVTLKFPDITGTSNTTAATLTGLPTKLQPSSSQIVVGRTVDNGVDSISLIDITSGTFTLYYGSGFTFTNAGTKGMKACTIKYRMS
jgi:hypothetical protein